MIEQNYLLNYLNSKSYSLEHIISKINNKKIKKSDYFSSLKSLLSMIEDFQKVIKSVGIKDMIVNNAFNALILIKDKNIIEVNSLLNKYDYENLLDNEYEKAMGQIKAGYLEKTLYPVLEFYLLHGMIKRKDEKNVYYFFIREVLIRENQISYAAFEKVILYFTKLKMSAFKVSPVCQIKSRRQIENIIRKKATKKRISIVREEIKALYYEGNYELLKNTFQDLAYIKNYGKAKTKKIDSVLIKELKEELLISCLPSYYQTNTNRISFELQAEKYALTTLVSFFDKLNIGFNTSDEPFKKEIEKLDELSKDNKRVYKDKEYTLDELFNGVVKIRPDVLKDFPTLLEEAIWSKLKMYIKNL